MLWRSHCGDSGIFTQFFTPVVQMELYAEQKYAIMNVYPVRSSERVLRSRCGFCDDSGGGSLAIVARSKDQQCRGINMVHPSTQSRRILIGGWKKISTYLYWIILCNVVKGWFSLDGCRGRNWPFWSHFIFMFGRSWIGVVEVSLQHACVILSMPDHVVCFPGCTM